MVISTSDSFVEVQRKVLKELRADSIIDDYQIMDLWQQRGSTETPRQALQQSF